VTGNPEKTLKEAVLRRMAGEQAYNRGLDAFKQGHVESVEATGEAVHAVVRGDRNYAVTLAEDEGILDYSCDCSIGAGGVFCMHCVASALAWADRASGKAKSPKRTRAKKVTIEDARKLIEAEDKESLVHLIFNWAKEDERIKDRIILYAATKSSPESGAGAIKQAFERAAKLPSRINHRETKVWVQSVSAAIDTIEQFLNDGHASATVGVCEAALDLLRRNHKRVDQSTANCNPLMDRVLALHYKACEEARPDPDALAKFLLEWELIWDQRCRLDQYRKALGERGVKAYRTHAEAEWAKQGSKFDHSRLSSVMERLARESGDIDQLAEVWSRNIFGEQSYLRIAKLYRDADRIDKALWWAKKGIDASPPYARSELTEFAVEEYHRQGNLAEVMNLAFAEYFDSCHIAAYKILEKRGARAGAWPEWRKKTLDEIRARIAIVQAKPRRDPLPTQAWLFTDHTLLVEIFLHEKNLEAALAEMQSGGCNEHQRERLEALSAEEHPHEFAGTFMNKVEAELKAGNLQRAVDVLQTAAKAMRQLGRGAEFRNRLSILLDKYKRNYGFVVTVRRYKMTLFLPD
jgi:uncharacterized Zn finger protein